MIGNNIKKWRELRNLKQSELAEILEVSDKTVSSWEINRTEPKMGMVEKICIALNCRKTDIIGEDTNQHNIQDYIVYLDDKTQILIETMYKNDPVLFEVYDSSYREQLITYANKLKELSNLDKLDDHRNS